jgi:hypothetical protein
MRFGARNPFTAAARVYSLLSIAELEFTAEDAEEAQRVERLDVEI